MDPSGSKRVAAKSLGEFYYKLALAWHGTYLKCPWALWAQKVSKFCSAGLFCIAVFCRRCRFARYTSISPHGRCKILQGRFFLAVPCVFLRLCLAGVLSGLGEARSQRFLECRVYTDSVANVVGCIESQSCLLVFGRLDTVGTIDMTCGAIPRTKSRGARGGQPPLTTHRKSYRTK